MGLIGQPFSNYRDGATPLFKACHKGHLDTITELLKHKPNLGILKNGETVLHAAALFGHLKVVRVLLNSGVDRNIKNKEGQTASDLAEEAGYDFISAFISDFDKVKDGMNGSSIVADG